MSSELRNTPLHGWHLNQQARMADFAGWSMPIQYSTIVEEHLATRNAVTLFDVSHMARFRFEGQGAVPFLDSILTRSVSKIQVGDIRYSLATNESGGVLDDVLVYNAIGILGEQFYGIVANASNRQKLLDWILPKLDTQSLTFTDETEASAMIAVQGPKSAAIVDQIIEGFKPSDLKYYSSRTGKCDVETGTNAFVSRTGYTGEDGFEIVVAAEWANRVWTRLLSLGEEHGIRAAGLARDTLRLEAGMPLYGHELSETINPLQAGLGFAVNLKGRSFPGSAQLAQFDKTAHPTLVGLAIEGKRVPRENYPVLNSDQQPIGKISSGTFSPTLQKPIAMAFVDPNHAEIGTNLLIDIRGKHAPAQVTKLPFYRRKKG